MNKAGAKSIPYYRKLKALKTTGKGIWNKKISVAAQEAKSAHRKWKDKKNLHLNADLEKQELKTKKKGIYVNYKDKQMLPRKINLLEKS